MLEELQTGLNKFVTPQSTQNQKYIFAVAKGSVSDELIRVTKIEDIE